MKKFDVDTVKLASCKVKSETGQEVQFGGLWQAGTTLFVFLRHFACISCRLHAEQMIAKKGELAAKGVRLVFIGNGQPHFIGKFKQQLQIPEAEVYTDPSLQAFRAAGFKRGFLASHGPKSVFNTAKMLA